MAPSGIAEEVKPLHTRVPACFASFIGSESGAAQTGPSNGSNRIRLEWYSDATANSNQSAVMETLVLLALAPGPGLISHHLHRASIPLKDVSRLIRLMQMILLNGS